MTPPLCKSCRHKPGARHASWCAIGNLDGPVLASECGEAVYQRHADGPLFTAADMAAATVVELPSEALTTAGTPPRGPVYVGVDLGPGDRSAVVAVERRPDGSMLILDSRGPA